ncbi:MAG TPA: MAPEG family protein, partial [Pseudoxanthomonas sp.]|nr:MAPEG family protein [Pseudoxanthomonas sp.]
MASASIFWPMVAMAALTLAVMLLMARERIGQLRRKRVHPQSVALSGQLASKLDDTRCADNFRNLFELPVLFYAALLVAFVTAQGNATVIGLAWAFVALRVAHSAIHCTYNKVLHRFGVYLAGALVLFVLWGRLAWGL